MRRPKTATLVALTVALALIASGAALGGVAAEDVGEATGDENETDSDRTDGDEPDADDTDEDESIEDDTATNETADGNETVAVTRSVNGTLDDETNVTDPFELIGTYDVRDDGSFGPAISTFVHEASTMETDGPFGRLVASFAMAHNPGSRPAHAGPPATDAGAPGHAAGNETAGPGHAGGTNDEPGPPARAGPDGTGDSATADGSDQGSGGGPPAHAGPNRGA